MTSSKDGEPTPKVRMPKNENCKILSLMVDEVGMMGILAGNGGISLGMGEEGHARDVCPTFLHLKHLNELRPQDFAI